MDRKTVIFILFLILLIVIAFGYLYYEPKELQSAEVSKPVILNLVKTPNGNWYDISGNEYYNVLYSCFTGDGKVCSIPIEKIKGWRYAEKWRLVSCSKKNSTFRSLGLQYEWIIEGPFEVQPKTTPEEAAENERVRG